MSKRRQATNVSRPFDHAVLSHCTVELLFVPVLTNQAGQHTVQLMNAISYTAARENLAATMDKVCDDHAPIIITRNRDQAVVMMSPADFEALEETTYVLKNSKNAKRVMSAIAQLDAGKGVERKVDVDA